MAGTGAFVLLAIGLFCYLIGMVGVIVGLVGNAWFVSKSSVVFKLEEGLIYKCEEDVNGNLDCKKRDSLFTFEDKDTDGENKDVVLSMLMACVVLAFVAFIISLVMICYRKKKGAWRCSAVASFCFGLLSALLGLAALGYSESKFSEKWTTNRHGWSNILCWVGCAGLILGAVLTVILVCVTPISGGREKNYGVHYVGNMNPTYQHDYASRY